MARTGKQSRRPQGSGGDQLLSRRQRGLLPLIPELGAYRVTRRLPRGGPHPQRPTRIPPGERAMTSEILHPVNRRLFLRSAGVGLGGLALSALLHRDTASAAEKDRLK